MFYNEKGVLAPSAKYFLTPSGIARELFFYITRCGHYFCDNRYSYNGQTSEGQVSSRRTFLLFYIRSGSMALRLDGRLYKASDHHAVLIDCRRPQEYYATSDLEFIWIHFDGANSRAFYEKIVQMRDKVFAVHDGGVLFRAMHELVSDCGRAGGLPEIVRSQRMYAILCQLLLPRTAAGRYGASPVDRALDYIRLHLGEKLTIRDVADSVGLSPSHFSRLFHSATALSPYEYILLQRMDRAKTLLVTTTYSVKEIAYMVGYGNEATFTTAFSDKVGVSPRAYRKLVNYLDL